MKFENTQPYKLGAIYRQLGDLLMNPKTDMRELAEFAAKIGFRIGIDIVPDEDSPLNGA